MMNEAQDRKFRKAVMTYFCVFLASIMEGFLVLLLWENGPALEVGDYSIDRKEIVSANSLNFESQCIDESDDFATLNIPEFRQILSIFMENVSPFSIVLVPIVATIWSFKF